MSDRILTRKCTDCDRPHLCAVIKDHSGPCGLNESIEWTLNKYHVRFELSREEHNRMRALLHLPPLEAPMDEQVNKRDLRDQPGRIFATAPSPEIEKVDRLTVRLNDFRRHVKAVAKELRELLDGLSAHGTVAGEHRGEVAANVTLSYRHLEDASMRLGKAIQARDGGTSVYDKATTVGA